MKKLLCVISLVILLCFTFGCQNKAEKAELEKFRAQAKVEEQNKALVKRFIGAWSKGDFEAFREVVVPEFGWYHPSSSPKPMSLEESIETGKALHSGFSDIGFSIEELNAEGDRVIFRYIFKATHQGEYEGIPMTGNKIETSGICIFRIENAKIVENREELNSLGFMQQLGMELKPKVTKK